MINFINGDQDLQEGPRPDLRLVTECDHVLPGWVGDNFENLAKLGFEPEDPGIVAASHGDWITLHRVGDDPLHLPTAPAGMRVISSAHGKFTDTGGDYWEAEARVFQVSPDVAIVAIVHCRDEVDFIATDPIDAKHRLGDRLWSWVDMGLELDVHFASH